MIPTQGRGPEARYQHSMHFLRSSNALVVIGGRTIKEVDIFKKPEIGLAADFARNCYFLNVEFLNWQRV